EFAQRHPEVVAIGRIGWVAKGVVYGLVGLLALLIGTGWQAGPVDGGDEASQSGAIAAIAQTTFGTVLLAVVTVGLFFYALWRIVTVLLPADVTVRSTLARIGYGISAIVYLTLGWSSLAYVLHPGTSGEGSSEDSRVESLTRDLLGTTGGRWLVAIGGLVVIGVSLGFLYRAITADFESQLERRGVGPLSHQHLVRMGQIGWLGRAAMLAPIGVFLVRAAWQFDPDEAHGLDGSLRRVADSALGMALVYVVGLGLIVYGIYCIASAPRRRLAPADE
ncbi:MAG: DUF1206 domain-containing protein, partial [Acidimicrobiales bacterium]|nr:DUF1206 domain-containing protein [Acidimicrobiales bacterium]